MKTLLTFFKTENLALVKQQDMLFAKGEKGAVKVPINQRFGARFLKNNKLFFSSKSYFRTFVSLVRNALDGVSQGYLLRLQLQGIGYRATVYPDTNELFLKTEGKILLTCKLDPAVFAKAKKQRIILFSLDKAALFANVQKIKNLQIPNPYTGKGIRIFGQVIPLKVGKQRNR